MSRGSTISGDWLPENDDELDDWHQDQDNIRLEPYKQIIQDSKPSIITVMWFTPELQFPFPVRISWWRRCLLFVFLGVKTENITCNN